MNKLLKFFGIQLAKIWEAVFSRKSFNRANLMAMTIATFGLILTSSFYQPAMAQGPATFTDETGHIHHVIVTLFKSHTIKVNQPFETAVVGQSEIADVMPMTDSSIYIQGKKLGTTNVSVFDPNKHLIGVIDLEVVPDTGTLRDKIAASTDGQNIHVTSANGQVVLSGEATDAVSASRAVAVAKGLSPDSPVVDAMKVKASQQVMLKVRFLEASRDAGRDLGVNWFGGKGKNGVINTGNGAFVNGTTSTGVPVISTIGTFAGASATAPFGTVLANLVNKGVSIDVMLTALEEKGLVKRLAEPDLIALSGDTASFLAGGEIPIPVVQSNAGSAPTITVEYKKFGVQLAFTPTVLANGIINLRLAPSVSEVDTTNFVQVSGFSIPSLTEREARTTVELRNGQSFAIAGLLQSTNVENISQVPWLGSVPVLGALFRSTSFQKHETDLVIVVTPSLVKPMAPGDHIASPFDQSGPVNDADLFAVGELERKKSYTEFVTSGGDLQGPYGHIIQVESPEQYVAKK